MTLEQMCDVIHHHQHKTQHRRGEHGGFVYEFIRLMDGAKLTVIAEIKQTECWLITGWTE